MERQGSGSRQAGSGVGSAHKMKNLSTRGGKGRGRPRKLPFPTVSRKLGEGLDAGCKVVVRCSDGLLYYGLILRVDEANDRCQIKFEEGSTSYVLFKDVHRVPGHEDGSCSICKGESSDIPNQIVFCDNCGIGYHQSCHNPPILNSIVESPGQFFCKLCTFAASVKHEVFPNYTSAFSGDKEDLRHTLPYKLNILTWDAQHRTNVEQCYCYCGGPGDWYCKMLQCCRCRQWFHEACVQCLQHPLLYGDRFFMFVCSHCNEGTEYLRRLPFKWVDIAHLALFNLTLRFTHKYYDLDEILMPWMAEHRHNLAIDSLLEGKSVKSPEVRNKIEAALMGHKSKFSSGREVKKKHTLWALNLRIPPNAPSVVVPLSGPITNEVLSNPSVKGRKTKHVLPTQCQSPIPLKYPSRSALDSSLSIMFKNIVPSKILPETNNNGLMKGYSNSTCYNGYNGMQNGSRSNGHSSHLPSSSSDSSEEEDPLPPRRKKKAVSRPQPSFTRSSVDSVSCKVEPQSPPPVKTAVTPPSPKVAESSKPTPMLLDRLVQRLPHYQGMNHPFMTEIEKETERQRLTHFETRMSFLKKEYAGELAAIALAQAAQENTSSGEKTPIFKPPLEQKHRRGAKRKLSESSETEGSPKDSVRRSKRSRMNAERYQHLLDSFPRHLPKPNPAEGPVQRWKWKSVVDQLRYGEKFQIQACRKSQDGRVEYLLHWDEEN